MGSTPTSLTNNITYNGDPIVASQTVLSDVVVHGGAGSIDVQPAAGVEVIIKSLGAGAAGLDWFIYDGANTVKIMDGAAGDDAIVRSIPITNSNYLRATATGVGNMYYDGVTVDITVVSDIIVHGGAGSIDFQPAAGVSVLLTALSGHPAGLNFSVYNGTNAIVVVTGVNDKDVVATSIIINNSDYLRSTASGVGNDFYGGYQL